MELRVLNVSSESGPVVELLPHVFAPLRNPRAMFFDRFARLAEGSSSAHEYLEVEQEVFAEARRLLASKLPAETLLAGRDSVNEQIGLAALVSCAVHLNQQDKLGFPYIEHPRRVFFNLLTALQSSSLSEQDQWFASQASWLHDVIEDSGEFSYRPITGHDLTMWGFDSRVVDIVKKLTRGEANPEADDYYRLIEGDEVARVVKLADIADNLANWRTELLSKEKKQALANKYSMALDKLGYSRERDGGWFDDRLNHFDQGPARTFALPESAQCLSRAQDLEPYEPHFRAPGGSSRGRDHVFWEAIDRVNESAFELHKRRLWGEEEGFETRVSNLQSYSIEAVFSCYLNLYAAGQAGDAEAQSDSEELAMMIDSMNRAERIGRESDLGFLPPDFTSLDCVLAFPRAVNLIQKLTTCFYNGGRLHNGSRDETVGDLLSKADTITILHATILDFGPGGAKWMGKVFKDLLTELHARAEPHCLR